MSEYEIKWHDNVWIQLEDIQDFIALFSKSKSEKIPALIFKAVSRLEHSPFIGQVESLLAERKNNYRYLLSGNFKIIYHVDKMTVYVSAIFDTRKNPDSLMKAIK